MVLSKSHSKGCFPTMDRTHNSVVLWQKSKDVGDHMSGVLPSTHGRTWPSANDTVSPFSTGQGKYGEGLDLGERSGLSNMETFVSDSTFFFFFYISMNHLKKWNTIILEQLYLMSWFLYRNQMFRNFTFIFYRKASNSTSNLSSSKSSSNLRMDVDMNTVQINIYYNFTNTHPRTVPQYWRNEVKGHFPAVVHTVCC